MKEYVDKVLIPYVESTRASLSLDASIKPLLLFDVYKVHCDEGILNHIKDAGFLHEFIPASCTGELQPPDLTVNAQFKTMMKEKFIEWYSQQITEDPNKHVDKLSLIKTIHARHGG